MYVVDCDSKIRKAPCLAKWISWTSIFSIIRLSCFAANIIGASMKTVSYPA